ncbi:flagellar hook protein FlgE [Pinirhizobacter sp.]|jgi:flagellar hook protein FlgE|uniref:flagellar hook protein FlgE n=1 Tax=Pinirhizobacter sp. TaxID=2950432 RepID=UPI002F3FB2B0
MALNTTLTGINAAQSDLNVISNNLANANTTGFKGSRAEFADVFAVTGDNINATAVGSGTRMTDVAQQFQQGDIENTTNSLDFAISGNGFFTVNTGDGLAYTRAGNFHKDSSGNVLTQEGYNLQVYPPNATGGFDTSTLKNLNLTTAQSSASATSKAAISANLPSSATLPTGTPFSTSDSTSYNNTTTFNIYDSQGGSHAATVYYVKTGTNTWDAHMFMDGQDAGTQPMTFDSTGKLTTPANGALAFNPVDFGNGSNPVTMTLDMSNTTQFGTDFSAGSVDKDGNEAGTLSSIDVDSKGVVTAYYSNNQTAQLGQVAMANFANLQGLRQVGNTTWLASGDSGTAVMGSSGTGQFGTVQSGALESSSTADTTSQLVDMIKAQRNYQANAQALTVDNTLASTLFNAISR